jgi:hypothetical protein
MKSTLYPIRVAGRMNRRATSFKCGCFKSLKVLFALGKFVPI